MQQTKLFSGRGKHWPDTPVWTEDKHLNYTDPGRAEDTRDYEIILPFAGFCPTNVT